MLERKRPKKNNEKLQVLQTPNEGWVEMRERLSSGVPTMGEISASAKDFQYLASPYSLNGTAEGDIRTTRYQQATRCAYKLMASGLNIYSPITYHHAVQAVCGFVNRPTKFWLELDFGILQYAKGLFVLMLDGWQNSIGVQREIEYARENGIPVSFIHPDAYILTGK